MSSCASAILALSQQGYSITFELNPANESFVSLSMRSPTGYRMRANFDLNKVKESTIDDYIVKCMKEIVKNLSKVNNIRG